MFDVLVSGAGPAGSKCAEELAKNGFKVALIERDANWRKPCGGAVSSRIFKYFPKLRKLNYSPITAISMFSADYINFKYSWKGQRDAAIHVDRLDFDNFVRNIAIDEGTELFDNHLSIDFVYKQGKKIGVKAKTREGTKELYGKLIIIADGVGSKLALKSGLRDKWKIEELGLAKCAIIEGETEADKEGMTVYFRPYKGYGWIIPLDGKRINVGCGTFHEDNSKYNLNTIYQEFRNNPNIKKYFPQEHYKTIWEGAYPLPGIGVMEKSLYDDNIMQIGDAAGFISPISGEGIHPGVVSGKVASEIASKALEVEDLSKQFLKQYRSHHNIKRIISNFKLKRSMVHFFYENAGRNLSKMFEIAQTDDKFREKVINMFLFSQAPSKEFFQKIRVN